MTTLEAQHEVITNLILENKKLEQERDELLIELEEYRSIAETIGAKKAVSEKEKAIRERDEAREALKKIEDRCVDCEDACDDIQKIMSLLEVLKKYAESPHCYDREDDYTPATYEAFHDGSEYGEILFARTLLEQIGVEFKYPVWRK